MTFGRLTLLVTFGMFTGVVALVAGEPPAPGTSRAGVIAEYGPPAGVVLIGTREILTYADGRVVLENGVVKSFEPKVAIKAGTPSPGPAASRPSGGPVSATKGASGGWLGDLEEAKALAAEQNKPILFLFTGDMSTCPSGARFNQLIGSNSSFARTMSSEFVMLRYNLSEQANTPETPYEYGGPEYRRFQEMQSLRSTLFSTNNVPAMAIISADGKRSIEVDLSEPTSVAGYNDMVNGTIRAVNAVKSSPMKNNKSLSAVVQKLNFSYIAIFALVVIWGVKRFTR